MYPIKCTRSRYLCCQDDIMTISFLLHSISYYFFCISLCCFLRRYSIELCSIYKVDTIIYSHVQLIVRRLFITHITISSYHRSHTDFTYLYISSPQSIILHTSIIKKIKTRFYIFSGLSIPNNLKPFSNTCFTPFTSDKRASLKASSSVIILYF